MEIEQVTIETEPAELESLRKYILLHGSEALEPYDVQEISSGFQRAPLLTGLVITGGLTLATELVKLIRDWMRYRQEERMKQTESDQDVSISELIARMRFEVTMVKGPSRSISFAELEALVKG